MNVATLVVVTWILGSTTVAAQLTSNRTETRVIDLVVTAGRALRVALDERVTVKRVGQPIAGILVDAVYAYDRIVVPAGTRVRGHVERLDNPSKLRRVRAMLSGDFTPARTVVLQFDALVLPDGVEMPLRTVVTHGVENLRRTVAGAEEPTGKLARARAEAVQRARGAVSEAKQKASDVLSAVKAPGKMERLEEFAMAQLPVRPQFLRKGTVYTAELQAPLTFGPATPIASAPAGTAPAPESLLTAKLVTPLDSAQTPRGTPIEAVLAEPVFSSEHQLLLPEGTVLTGEVTLAKRAARFRRNGQLRFLFERVQVPEQPSQTLLASLSAVDASDSDRLTVDEEGGARATNTKTRFVAPALALVALHGAVGHGHHAVDHQTVGSPAPAVPSANLGSRSLGGFIGFGALGVGLGQLSRPLAIVFSAIGATRTVYTNVFGRGQDVSFPAATTIQLQLAPGPAVPGK